MARVAREIVVMVLADVARQVDLAERLLKVCCLVILRMTAVHAAAIVAESVVRSMVHCHAAGLCEPLQNHGCTVCVLGTHI